MLLFSSLTPTAIDYNLNISATMHAAALISGTCKLQNVQPLQIYGTLKIVASHYVQWESKVRCGCALLNMSKAFDMIDHGHLFDLLLQHKLP